jgi:hypothetical protein
MDESSGEMMKDVEKQERIERSGPQTSMRDVSASEQASLFTTITDLKKSAEPRKVSETFGPTFPGEAAEKTRVLASSTGEATKDTRLLPDSPKDTTVFQVHEGDVRGFLTKEERRQRERAIWDLRVKCYTVPMIAKALNIHTSVVHQVLKQLNRKALYSLTPVVLHKKAEQVGQLEYIACEAMEAWERSKQASKGVQKRVEQLGTGTAGMTGGNRLSGSGRLTRETVTTRVEDQDGDPRYLQTAMSALAEIRKVLGLEQMPLVGDGGTLVLNQEVSSNTVLMIGGTKEEYIQGLRQLRGEAINTDRDMTAKREQTFNRDVVEASIAAERRRESAAG